MNGKGLFNKTQSVDQKQMLKEFQERQETEQRKLDDDREREMREFENKNKRTARKQVIMPTYKKDDRLGCFRETNIPPNMLYEPLGYDRVPNETQEKHYRKFITKEAEKDISVMSKETDFNCYQIKRGQTRGASGGGGFFGMLSSDKTDESGAPSTEEIVGKFKGLITVTRKSDEKEKRNRINKKLSTIIELIGDIYAKKFNGKQCPIKKGFFCEFDPEEI